MLVPRQRRQLLIDARHHPRGQPHLSSASGIVRVGRRVYIVADDEHHLACLDSSDVFASRIELLTVAQGELPHDRVLRKKHKPDLEVLFHLPGGAAGDAGLLVLLGSGSRPQRERVFTIEVREDGQVAGDAVEITASGFYAPLRELFDEPNLEAGCVDGARVHLFQRANRGQGLNFRITYDAEAMSAWLRGGAAPAPQPVAVHPLSLGSHDGVPFGITDATWESPTGCVLTAVAEDTRDAYNDGACVASMLARMDARGHVVDSTLLAGAPKVEGVATASDGRLWLVTDADDPDRPSELLEYEWKPPQVREAQPGFRPGQG